MPTDFLIDKDEQDIAIDDYGYIRHTDNVVADAIARRAATPELGYARAIRKGSELIVTNAGYWTNLPYMLSSTEATEGDFLIALSRAARDDGRASVIDVSVNVDKLNSKVKVQMVYSLASNIQTAYIDL
jgi:hypothetical protein